MGKITKLWYSYDFANSFASSVLVFYYPLILAEKGVGSAWIGIPASISTIILLIILPRLGNYSDAKEKKMFFIRIASILMLVSLAVIAFLSQHSEIFSLNILFLLSVCYILFQVCFQGSFGFYSAMLRNISNPENSAKISGIGIALGQLGNVLSLGIIGIILGSSFVFLGLSGKPLAFLLGGLLFVGISLPFLLQKESPTKQVNQSFSYKALLKKVFSDKKRYLFIVGYSLLADSILTFQIYITVYLKDIFNFSDQLIAYAGITGLVSTVIGGFVIQAIVTKIKDKEKTYIFSAIFYSFCFFLYAVIPEITWVAFVCLAFSGFAYAMVFSLARSIYSEISPENEQAGFFSIFTIFERAASVVGPLVWLAAFYVLEKFGKNMQYRGAVLVLAITCLVGFYFLKKSSKFKAIS